jgi:hypothetical protein
LRIKDKEGRAIMSSGKYDRYLTQGCVKLSKLTGELMMSTRQLESFGDGKFSIDCVYVTSSRLMIETPHQHTFSQYLCFFSANSTDANDFDGEIEISLGEEGEMHRITSPTVVYVEVGLSHGPLNFARVGKPILFIDIALTGAYARVGNPSPEPGAK